MGNMGNEQNSATPKYAFFFNIDYFKLVQFISLLSTTSRTDSFYHLHCWPSNSSKANFS